MKSKDKILEILNNSENFLSGEAIAKSLDISRNAVWKAMKELEKEGYEFEAVSNKGYLLKRNCDVLKKEEIEKCLNEYAEKFNITVLESVDSTNNYLKAREKQVKEFDVVIAKSQTSGRGRFSRSFYSPDGSGIYMSVFLQPKISTKDSFKITTMAAVAVCEAIRKTLNKEAKIKWVNDVYFEDKKICGILTEGAINFETESLDYAILGIGVDYYCPTKLDEQLKEVVGNLENEKRMNGRNRLIAKILEEFYLRYESFDVEKCLKEYRESSCIIGENIYVIKGEQKISAVAEDICENFALKVRYENGEVENLTAGEVSIKKK